MVKLEAKKDGRGNITISEDSFEHLLNCLDNQKFVGEVSPNGDAMAMDKDEYNKVHEGIQDAIDNFNGQCRNLLHNA
jgi:CYTH domain-containing protein